jgi:16S rRNA (uracil1498-N3)-methyltransferase
MSETRPKIRLYVAADLAAGATCTLEAGQAHYLRNVMRLATGAEVAVFNGRDGEWRAAVQRLERSGGMLEMSECLRPQTDGPDLWLLFAPLKRQAVDFLAQKATELGVSRLQPVRTLYTNKDRVNEQRLASVVAEAAEQSGRLTVPEVRPAVGLERAIDNWPGDRTLFHCDETGRGETAFAAMSGGGPGALLIGPEGGFDERERRWLADLPFVRPISLGPRVLRAETAALAALTLWQACAGDW